MPKNSPRDILLRTDETGAMAGIMPGGGKVKSVELPDGPSKLIEGVKVIDTDTHYTEPPESGQFSPFRTAPARSTWTRSASLRWSSRKGLASMPAPQWASRSAERGSRSMPVITRVRRARSG